MVGWVSVYQVQIGEISHTDDQFKISGKFKDYLDKQYTYTVTLDKYYNIIEAKILQ